ncbi:hypothetical protein VTK26DRAFT_7807 [Humicola hyalothermophila]
MTELAMNFQAPPPSFHDPLLYAQTTTTPSPTPRPQQQQHQLPYTQQQQQQQPLPSPSQSQPLQPAMNGINGANMPGAMLPTPAGHQAELNYIYGMVEELSRQLADNQRTLEEVVAGVGRVRSRARAQSLANDDIISSAADDVKAQEPNLDTLISILSEALEKAKYSRDHNLLLLTQYASVLSSMLRQFHEYKARHVADVAAWHRSYRAQLAEARAENCRLREQIWEMQAHAGAANELLRRFRARYDADRRRWDRQVDARAVRQELRFWKRMAMPHLPDDDPYWSDDDDLVDVAEKKRLEELQRLVAEQQQLAAAAASSSGGSGELGCGGDDGEVPPEAPSVPGLPQSMGVMAGTPMQREESMMPVLPPRPSSAASSTGSSGQ